MTYIARSDSYKLTDRYGDPSDICYIHWQVEEDAIVRNIKLTIGSWSTTLDARGGDLFGGCAIATGSSYTVSYETATGGDDEVVVNLASFHESRPMKV